ncbi:MAG: PEP/pyruvate-binding domain-containing protein [Phycisphaerales bacterium]
MSSLRKAIVLIVAAMAVGPGVPGWSQGKGDPGVPPVEDPNVLWRDYLRLPEDSFLVHGTAQNEASWVKFIVVPQADGSQKVHFQDGHAYPFHYQGAVANLDIFAGMTSEQFDRATLYREGRKAVLGAVICPSVWWAATQPAEYGIQLVGIDPFTREEVAAIFDVVERAVATETPYTAFYFPTFEQRAEALSDVAWLESKGILISSSDRWASGNTIYSNGWALGTLKYVAGGAIRDAYVAGQLGPGDILLTDGVPAETPYLAGIVTLSASTPNSHVAILAKTTGVPFLHVVVPEDVHRVQSLIGHRVCLRAYDAYGWTTVRLTDTDGVLDDTTVQEILALKKPKPLTISPATPLGDYAMNADALMPADIRYVGGKAANFGMLRRAIPENSPVAAAFSFDLWTDFLSQKLADGRTLRETIAGRLSPFAYPPADMASLANTLHDIRDLIENDNSVGFTDPQKQAVLAILQEPQYGFDPSRKLRFRSSTNVEDGLDFTGAGLYESHSGCLIDELDGDEDGSCHCDPSRPRERGVFNAIRKVFASFYNENAYLERLRQGIDESKVGMAMLVHHSFPDEGELANGVAVIRRNSKWSWDITLTTQAGAVSVTNPEDGSIPEEVLVTMYSFGQYAQRVRQSNMVQLGATVMTWEDDYYALGELLVKVGEEFGVTTGREEFVLETEFKKLTPDGKLIVKQVREIPQADETPSITPFLLKEPASYVVLQGEYGDVFANHRLKSRWQLQTRNLWLTPENLIASLYESASVEYVVDGVQGSLSGPLSQWPQASHSYTPPSGGRSPNPDEPISNSDVIATNGATVDSWKIGNVANPRTYHLRTENIPGAVAPSESAIVTLEDFRYLVLEVEYERPVVQWNWEGPTMATRDQVRLCPAFEPSSDDLPQKRHFEEPNGVAVDVSFYWPPYPKGPTAGYTAPLARWVETKITGYTSEPIVLHGEYSQTYRPEHHNFAEHFLFEPQLEPGLSPTILAELKARDIRYIHILNGMDNPTITTYGYDEEGL